MRFPFRALAFVLAVSAVSVAAQTAAAPPLTLAEAMRLAEAANPGVKAREAQLEAAEGLRREAGAPLANNPELSADNTRVRAADGRTREWAAGVSQVFETGGQQRLRRSAAAANLEALRAEIDDARRQARADAALRFHAVLAEQRRVAAEQRSLELFDTTAQAVAKRRAAGEDTRLDANVALIEAERARNAVAAANEKLADALHELGVVLQLPPSALPAVAGDLALLPGDAPPYALEQLVAGLSGLPKQRALGAREDAARARLDIERAKSRAPDVTVGLNVGRAGFPDARERQLGVSVAVPLPLFNHNDAAIGQASSDATLAAIERGAVARDTEAQVRSLWARLESQRQRVQRLERTVLATTSDNRRLAAMSRQAGQIGLLDQLVVQRQSVDAERELIDALADYHATRIELERAAAWPREGNR